MRNNVIKILGPCAGLAIILLAWHYYIVLFHVPPVVLPSPAAVAVSLISDRYILLSESWVTFLECIYGFFLAMLLGIPIAIVMTYSKTLHSMFYPLLVASQSIPKVALAPILLVWFGTGIESKLVMVFVIAFFPIVVDTSTGLRSTSPELLELARSLQSSRLQTFFKVQLPSALPLIFSGAKIAVTLAVIGAVIGEYIGSNDGLGTLLLAASSQMNTALAWAALVILSLLGMLLYAAVVLAERVFMPWADTGGQQH
jgi:NitT/TauT family transport system permease protein